MSKLQIVAIAANVALIIVACHIALSTWVDHTNVPFEYFYFICGALIINAIEAYSLTFRSSK
jgi:hypothetical protein